jgi:Fe-S cluster assembly ATP-binding protein
LGDQEIILECQGLRLRRNQRVVLDGLDLRLARGDLALLYVEGRPVPTTVAEGLVGVGRLQVEAGSLRLRGEDVAGRDAVQRSRQGMILVDPGRVVAGVTVTNHVRLALREQDRELGPQDLRRRLLEALETLELDSHFAGRTLPEDPPLLDRLRVVLLTLAVLRPDVAVFPVGDDGVDLDVVRLLVHGLQHIDRAATALVLLTRDARLAQTLPADQKWHLLEGRCVGPVGDADHADDDDDDNDDKAPGGSATRGPRS